MFDFKAVGLLLEEDPDEAFRICNERLREYPEDVRALFLVGVITARAERHSLALPVFERCTRLAPNSDESWNNLGMALQECGEPAKAREAFKHALSLKAKPGHMANIGVTYLSECDYAEAIRWCKRALDKAPGHEGALGTLGFASLGAGDWATGWPAYEATLGGRFRKEKQWGNEPRWDGSPVDSVVIYGEQGLGDEIMYASCVADARARAKHVVIECDPRLESIFRRSFVGDGVEVFGTRRSESPWAVGRAFDARAAIGSLASLFRPSPESCPRVPYLTADPERRLQWRALFDSWRKPVIGIAWSGGRAVTNAKDRQVGLEAFRGLIERTDAHFVSLQYKDPTAEIVASGLPVKHYARATLTNDYDDTAALVAECDMVIGPPTAVHHLAGALGVPSTVLVPSKPMWNVAHGDRRAWYADQPYHKQRPGESWPDCLARLDVSPWRKAA